MSYTKREHPGNFKTYKNLLKVGIASIPDHHRHAAGKRDSIKGGTDFELQRIQHYYAVYKIINDDTYVVAALLHQERDIPERLKELQSMTKLEIDIIQKTFSSSKI